MTPCEGCTLYPRARHAFVISCVIISRYAVSTRTQVRSSSQSCRLTLYELSRSLKQNFTGLHASAFTQYTDTGKKRRRRELGGRKGSTAI